MSNGPGTLTYSIADLDSARHDGDSPPPRHKLIVCSSPRTGSYLLAEALRRLGLGVPHEYFNPPTMRVLCARWAIPVPHRDRKPQWWRSLRRRADRRNLEFLALYLDRLQLRRTRNGVFAAKIQHWQYERLLDNAFGHELFAGARVAYLYREDLLAQAISLRLAEITGQWGTDGVATTRAVRNIDPLDMTELHRAVERLRAEEEGWKRTFARLALAPATLSYESMRDDPLSAARRLALELLPGVAQDALPPVEVSRAESGSSAVRASMRDAYLKVRGLPKRVRARRPAGIGGRMRDLTGRG